jgi:hypothetical protein
VLVPQDRQRARCAAGVRAPRREEGAGRDLEREDKEVGAPAWRRRASFRYRQERRLQHELVVTVRLPAQGPEIDESRRLYHEKEDYFGCRWWPVQEVLSGSERFYPGKLPALLGPFLDGQDIDEPFELWS